MNTTASTSITIAEQCYRLLLWLYPADHRAEYGTLMVQAFRDLCRDAYRRSGLVGLVEVWAHILLDTLWTALQERKAIMLKTSWRGEIIPLLGGLLFLVFGASQATVLLPVWERWRYESLTNLAMGIGVLPAIVSLILTSILLSRRYGSKMTDWARWLLGVAAVAGVFVIVLWLILNAFKENEPPGLWDVSMVILCVHLLALGIFGIGNLRWRAFPRGNFLPIFIGLPFPLAMLAQITLFRAHTQRADDAAAFAFFIASLIMGAALGLLGLALMAEKKTAQ